MQTIWKFPIEITDLQNIEMPVHAQCLHAGPDPSGRPCVWAVVEPGAKKVIRQIAILGTGNPIPEEVSTFSSGSWQLHLGTFIDGPFVWHVFDQGPF